MTALPVELVPYAAKMRGMKERQNEHHTCQHVWEATVYDRQYQELCCRCGAGCSRDAQGRIVEYDRDWLAPMNLDLLY